MTEQHPLTDEIIDELRVGKYSKSIDHNMRAAADWQLEQDAEAWKTILNRLEMIPPHVVDSIIEEFKQAMRPQQQQENTDGNHL